jgi:hypothetical protein
MLFLDLTLRMHNTPCTEYYGHFRWCRTIRWSLALGDDEGYLPAEIRHTCSCRSRWTAWGLMIPVTIFILYDLSAPERVHPAIRWGTRAVAVLKPVLLLLD